VGDELARYRIATIPGDGVGPDVVRAARDVVDAAGRTFGFAVEWAEYLVGGIAIDTFGVAIRPEDVEACGAADAILLGAVGGPKWSDPSAPVRPEQALFALRGGLGLYANLRPVSVHSALIPSSPVRPELLRGVDMVIVRELTGGVYFGERVEAGPVGGGERRAVDSGPYTETEVRRVVELAFRLAADRRSHVTSVDKANPIGTVLSAAMLLGLSLGRDDAASAVEAAVSGALDAGFRTADLVPRGADVGAIRRVGTRGMTEAILARVAAREAVA
jgi:isocitrate/isopropylmalate dehydrogenase